MEEFNQPEFQTRIAEKKYKLSQVPDPEDSIIALQKKVYARYINGKDPVTHVSGMYNCHGLVLGSRRGVLMGNIEKILLEDDYERIRRYQEVLPGDVIVYSENGDYIHSGIVADGPGIYSPDVKNISVRSKWGMLEEYIHGIEDCPYIRDGVVILYYRVRH